MAYVLTLPAGALYGSPSLYRGLGAATAQTYGSAGTGVASSVIGIVQSPTVGGKIAAGGGAVMSVAPLTGPLAPVVFIAGALVTIAGSIMSFVGLGDGCGQSCILTSKWANDAEALLKQNANAYFSQQTRTASEQAVALSNFDSIWGQLEKACSAANLSTAGVNCIGDRQAGACKWRASDNGPWPGSPKQGSCWNWFAAYRDPIANDSAVVPDSTFGDMFSGASGSAAASGGGSLIPMLVVGGLLAAAVML